MWVQWQSNCKERCEGAHAGNGELWGGIKLGMVWDGWPMTCWMSAGTLFLPYLLSACGWGHPAEQGGKWDLQEWLLVAVLQETLTFSLQSTSPGWVFLTVQAKCTCYHSGLAAGPSCASFPGSHSRRTQYKIQNSSLGHNFTFFSLFFFSFFPPLLGAAEPLW